MFHRKKTVWAAGYVFDCPVFSSPDPLLPLTPPALCFTPPTRFYFVLPTYPRHPHPCPALLVLHRSASVPTAAVPAGHVRPVVPDPLRRLKVLLLQRFPDPGAVAVDAERLEELLLGVLEGGGRHLGLGVGGQGEEVGAAAALAQRAEQAEQVGLGHSGHAQLVPEDRKKMPTRANQSWEDKQLLFPSCASRSVCYLAACCSLLWVISLKFN